MSDPMDDKALADYLQGSSEISRRYRGLGGDEVPPELDARVMELARRNGDSPRFQPGRENGDSPRKSLLRWSAPLALAKVGRAALRRPS